MLYMNRQIETKIKVTSFSSCPAGDSNVKKTSINHVVKNHKDVIVNVFSHTIFIEIMTIPSYVAG